jgi:hypothetical protein
MANPIRNQYGDIKGDIITVSDILEILFVRVSEGWFWGAVRKDGAGKFSAPMKFHGPFSDYRGARIGAWELEIARTVWPGYEKEVGYAWDLWVQEYSKVLG